MRLLPLPAAAAVTPPPPPKKPNCGVNLPTASFLLPFLPSCTHAHSAHTAHMACCIHITCANLCCVVAASFFFPGRGKVGGRGTQHRGSW